MKTYQYDTTGDILNELSKWQRFKMWLRYRKDYKKITIWVRKESE